VNAVFPGFGPESRDVGGAQARRGVGSADSVRICHGAVRGAPSRQRRKLANLGALRVQGFKVCVFPLKLMGASAAPVRVMALLEE
jgi:kynurenine formamidase